MPKIRKQKIIAYSQDQMYTLVNDIESYSAFIPFCVKSTIDHRDDNEIHATLAFARGGLQKSFSTVNRLEPHHQVEIRLLNGPFKHLEGFWRFEAIGVHQCRVSLDLEFEFSSRLLAMMFGPLFNQVASMLVDSFCKRAEKVYGKTSP